MAVTLDETLARLDAAGIRWARTNDDREIYACERDGFAALVRRAPSGAWQIGSTGAVSEHGMALLLWRDGRPFLSAKGGSVPVDEAQVAALRRFSDDLKRALS